MPPASPARRAPPRPRGRPAAAAALALALGACASAGGRAPLPAPDAEACRPTGPTAARPGTLAVAADGDVEPLHAPLPGTDAERLLFRQLYATLVEVDCLGHVRPGLAGDWSRDENGRRWTFRLDPEARFVDGSPVTAGAVATAWHATDLAAGAGRPSPLDGLSVSAPSAGTVVVALDEPLDDPAAFADPRFAVTGPGGRTAWPLASGALRPAPVAGPRLPGRAVGLAPRDGASGRSRLRVAALGESGARDALDAGADLLLTRRSAAADYAASLSGYRVHPLPWDRTWVVALPAVPAALTADGGEGWEAVRRGLAGEAIPAEARPADPAGLPWRGCGVPADGSLAAGDGSLAAASGGAPVGPVPPSGGDRGAGVIVYPADEPAGRALAARLAALAAGAGPGGEAVARTLGSGGAAVRTEGLDPAGYERSLGAGSAAAYLVPLPLRPLAPCRLRRAVQRRAPWLRHGGRLVPLVDTRRLLVLRRGLAGVRLDWDGVPRLDRAGWTADAPPEDAGGRDAGTGGGP